MCEYVGVCVPACVRACVHPWVDECTCVFDLAGRRQPTGQIRLTFDMLILLLLRVVLLSVLFTQIHGTQSYAVNQKGRNIIVVWCTVCQVSGSCGFV